MLIIRFSFIKTLAFIALFARHATTLAGNNFVSPNEFPKPDDPPKFYYNFNVVFKDGRCSASQQDTIVNTVNNIAGLSDRVKLWKEDIFHDWQPEVNYWFGEDSAQHATQIKNNFLRVSTAIKDRKEDWTTTWVYVGCDYTWPGYSKIKCQKDGDVFYSVNDYGYWVWWDIIYWNFCPDFWTLPSFSDKVKSTVNNPARNPHYMEKYLYTAEQILFPAFLSIRSIGIDSFPLSQDLWTLSPYRTWKYAQHDGSINFTLTNYMSNFYTAMAITIPESFNWGTRPLITRGEKYTSAWSNMNNSDGTDPAFSPQMSILGSVSNDTKNAIEPASSDVAPFTTFDNYNFPAAVDTVHPSTENCFTFLPSILVQGTPAERCDCGTTIVALTTQGSSTGCALSGSFITLDQYPPRTIGAVMPSSSSTPVPSSTPVATTSASPVPVVTPKPDPTRAFEIMYMSMKTLAVPLQTVQGWSIYAHSPGHASTIDACGAEATWMLSATSSAYPTSLGLLTNVPAEYSGCEYRGPAAAVGSVSCPDMPAWTRCSVPMETQQQVCNVLQWVDYFNPQVECAF